MDPKKVIAERTDVRTNRVEASIFYLHEDYGFNCYLWKEITKTGLLKVAALKPKRKSLPEFTFRWDEKTDILKVYILGVPDNVRRSFEKGIDGYAGHYTTRVPDCKERRVFKALIEIPGIRLFYGCITIPLCRSVKATISITTRTTGKLQVTKKTES